MERMHLLISIVIIFCCFCYCSDRNGDGLSRDEIIELKERLLTRSADKIDSVTLCIISTHLDSLNSFDRFDRYYGGFGFKYVNCEFEYLTVVLVKHFESQDSYVFSTLLLKSLFAHYFGESRIIEEEGYLDISKDEEFVEVNRLLSKVDRDDFGVVYTMFKLVHSVHSRYLDYPESILNGPLSHDEVQDWIDRNISDSNIMYSGGFVNFSIDNIGLMSVKVDSKDFNVRILIPNHREGVYRFSPDSRPEVVRHCYSRH
jgi:hypothetical protein